MNFRQIRDAMTLEALSLEYVLRGQNEIGLRQLAEACQIDEVKAEFILEQMKANNIVEVRGPASYALTKEYRKAKFH